MRTRHLLLVRHGKAAWEQGAQTDFDRTLTAAGRREAEEVGTWVNAHGPRPEVIVSSPAPRALETATLIAAAWPDPPAIITEPSLYDAPPEGPIRVIEGLDDARRVVLVVGHNPSISHCADWLIGEPTVLELPTAGLVWLELDAPRWREASPGGARVRECGAGAPALNGRGG